MPYILSIVAIAASGLLWCKTVRKELSWLKRNVDNAAKQVEFHKNLHTHADNNSDMREQAEKMLSTSLTIYIESAKQYNQAVKKPQNRLPAIIMRYRLIAEIRCA